MKKFFTNCYTELGLTSTNKKEIQQRWTLFQKLVFIVNNPTMSLRGSTTESINVIKVDTAIESRYDKNIGNYSLFLIKWFLCSILTIALTGCNISERLDRVGKSPDFKKVNTYEEEIYDTYAAKGLTDPINKINNEETTYKTANSLWRPGSRTFFRDQRARSVGDVLKVVITIQDKAKMDNQTQASRNDTSNLGVPNLLGYEASASKVLPEAVNPSKLVGIRSADTNAGIGKIDRKETINTTIAATVVKILPSNNLLIRGSQEIKVNTEVREVTVEGIVRPEDINSNNAVTLDQIAEARVTYGGRGNISDYQQPRYGKQVLDAILPF